MAFYHISKSTAMKKFTPDHEWIIVENNIGKVGITDHAQDALGDIVFVDLPEIGRVLSQGEEGAVVESVKAAGEVKNPVAGKVIAVNNQLTDNPSLINDEAENAGWIYQLEISDLSQLDGLMDESAYQTYLNQ